MWYVLQVAGNKEERIRDDLISNGYQALVPCENRLIRSKGSWIKKKYGSLNRLTWSEDLSKGFDECWRVLKPGGTLIFKWNETQISLREVLSCFSRRPVFGHTTTKHRDTHWMTFYKDAALKAVEEGK